MKMEYATVSAIVDGPLYKRVPHIRQQMLTTMEQLLDDKIYDLSNTEDYEIVDIEIDEEELTNECGKKLRLSMTGAYIIDEE